MDHHFTRSVLLDPMFVSLTLGALVLRLAGPLTWGSVCACAWAGTTLMVPGSGESGSDSSRLMAPSHSEPDRRSKKRSAGSPLKGREEKQKDTDMIHLMSAGAAKSCLEWKPYQCHWCGFYFEKAGDLCYVIKDLFPIQKHRKT